MNILRKVYAIDVNLNDSYIQNSINFYKYFFSFLIRYLAIYLFLSIPTILKYTQYGYTCINKHFIFLIVGLERKKLETSQPAFNTLCTSVSIRYLILLLELASLIVLNFWYLHSIIRKISDITSSLNIHYYISYLAYIDCMW